MHAGPYPQEVLEIEGDGLRKTHRLRPDGERLVDTDFRRVRVATRRRQGSGHRFRAIRPHGVLGRPHMQLRHRRRAPVRQHHLGGRALLEEQRRLAHPVGIADHGAARHLHRRREIDTRDLRIEAREDDVVDGYEILPRDRDGALDAEEPRLRVLQDEGRPAIHRQVVHPIRTRQGLPELRVAQDGDPRPRQGLPVPR